MNIHRVEDGDHAEWLRMRQALWHDYPIQQLEAELAEIAADTHDRAVFVARRPSGELGGFVEVSLHPHAIGCTTKPVGYMEGWYVDPDLRRTGIGHKLLAEAEQWAIQRGCQEMASDTELGNEISRSAHLAAGYQEAERAIHFKKRIAK